MFEGKKGVVIGGAAIRGVVKNGKVIGTAGVGIEFTGTSVAAWADGNDLRSLGGVVKMSIAVTLSLETNNQK